MYTMNNLILKKIKIIIKKYNNYKKIFYKNNYYLSNNKNKILNKYNLLKKINDLFILWKNNEQNLKIAKILLLENNNINDNFNKEFNIYKNNKIKYEKLIYENLLPKDNNDNYNCFLEIHAASGGNEASLFANDLFKMYCKYCENNNFKIKIVNISQNEIKGYKEIIFLIKGKNCYKRFKFESGGHRVQRIPITETQGRLHTSTCTIAVIPKLPTTKLPKIENKDLKIDTYKSSGAGGQHVNTTESAIRITHLPTGIVVECQDERSQHKNKNKAMLILKNRIYDLQNKLNHQKFNDKKKILLGSGDRSNRIRTYNFPQGRITDHRINLNLYNLEEILNGNLKKLFDKLEIEYNKQLLDNINYK